MSVSRLKRLFEEYLAAEAAADRADSAWGEDPCNESLEKAFDEAYEAQGAAFDRVVSEIVVFTSGQIDRKTAGTMLRLQRSAIEDLITRVKEV